MDLVMEDQVRAADSGKEKNSALGPSFPISNVAVQVDQRHDHLDQPLLIYHVSNGIFRCSYTYKP